MFWTYLFRELSNRRKQTAIIASGLALAIALVIIVNSFSGGVKAAQATVLQSVYGVGTDITISQAETPSSTGGRPTFSFGSGGGSSTGNAGSGSSTNLSQSRVTVARGTAAFASTQLATVKKTAGVKSAAATLSLQMTDFSGTVTQKPSTSTGSGSGTTGGFQRGTGTGTEGGGVTGGGFGGGNFSFDSTTIEGVDVTADAVGPISSVSLSSGRTFKAADTGKDVVILDKSYAKTNSKKVGDTVTIGSTKFTVIGLVASTSSSSTTASNMYIPLDTAQKISSETGKVTNIYVTADSAGNVSSLKSALEKALPKATVSDEADLASSVSGSLSTASSLVSTLGTWLSVLVLAAAFLIAILFTVSGVTRRTREFGTLKAIGWSNGRIVRQVAGESFVQGLIGGVVGVAVGLIGVLVINIIGPTLSGGATTTTAFGGGGFGGGAPGGAAGGTGTGTGTGTEGAAGAAARFGQAAAKATTSVTLHAPVAVEIIVIAVVLAIVGGLLAGAIGGWRASRLRPAEALRSVA
ncbi:ABC transporter permease [Frondihabitans australicus]|uniref:FtsX-like permease family protein n=1 Tax=Frondihabitans australicus TaxID=386892 RepID=A0A495ICT3_9MICO|nr:ABC transporter permease [Frondihabitans australicus]RKR73111.1 FtsX-like permease family protein [Frondihabitans australicus]